MRVLRFFLLLSGACTALAAWFYVEPNAWLAFVPGAVFLISALSYVSASLDYSRSTATDPARPNGHSREEEVFTSAIGQPVIVLWPDDNPRVGFIEGVSYFGVHASPSMVVKDYITGEEVDTLFGQVYLYTSERMEVFLKMSRKQRNAFGSLAFNKLCVTRPYRNSQEDRLTYEDVLVRLSKSGFYERYRDWLEAERAD